MKISRNQEVLKVDCDKIRNAPVIKANSLVEAHYSLNLIHQKIILIIASQVKVDDTSFNEIEMPVADLLNLLNFFFTKLKIFFLFLIRILKILIIFRNLTML